MTLKDIGDIPTSSQIHISIDTHGSQAVEGMTRACNSSPAYAAQDQQAMTEAMNSLVLHEPIGMSNDSMDLPMPTHAADYERLHRYRTDTYKPRTEADIFKAINRGEFPNAITPNLPRSSASRSPSFLHYKLQAQSKSNGILESPALHYHLNTLVLRSQPVLPPCSRSTMNSSPIQSSGGNLSNFETHHEQVPDYPAPTSPPSTVSITQPDLDNLEESHLPNISRKVG